MKIAVIILIVATTFFIIRSIYNRDVAEKDVLEEMVMPGLVSDYHAEFENDCSACHSPFSKESQNGKCVSCHKEVGKDLIQKSGYHGRFEQVSAMKCKSCHTEHKGRNAVLVLLDRETFDHKFTDYTLVGAHAGISVGCEDCHEVGEKYRVVKGECFNCHEEDDIHKGRLGQKCKDCHKETSFKNASFDHSETGFALEGKHKETACGLCHPDESYKNIPEACIACHLINDIHDSKPDDECGRCHNSIYSWSKYNFDHSKETKFNLKDRHAMLKCDSCHPRTIFKERPGLECFNCHKDDDIHKGRTGPECEKCHDSIKWKHVKFDHDKDTEFKLLGKHKNTTCMACHKDSSSENELDITCIGCHRSNDVHLGQLGVSCENCHNVNEWGDQIKFEHDLTQFPLIGQHAITPCGECHLSSTFKEDLKIDCFSCHQLDDGHELKLGTYCADCHNPNGWRLWEFDHNSQTEFKLEGSHTGLHCQTCHREPMEKKVEISNTCYSCHKDMDVHLGRFGRFGERCDLCHHNVNEFKIVNNIHKISRQGELEFIEKDCYTCHEVDDIHYGSYGRLCGRCHIEESFFKLKTENH
jgi:hypothetical protein